MDSLSRLFLLETCDSLGKCLSLIPETTSSSLLELFKERRLLPEGNPEWPPVLTFSKQVALLSLCKSCALQQEPAEDAEAVRLIVDFIENQLLNYQWNVSQPEGVLEWPAEWFTGALMQRWLLCSGISAQVEQLVIQSITQHLRNIRIHMQSAGCEFLYRVVIPSLSGTLKALVDHHESRLSKQTIVDLLRELIHLLDAGFEQSYHLAIKKYMQSTAAHRGVVLSLVKYTAVDQISLVSHQIIMCIRNFLARLSNNHNMRLSEKWKSGTMLFLCEDDLTTDSSIKELLLNISKHVLKRTETVLETVKQEDHSIPLSEAQLFDDYVLVAILCDLYLGHPNELIFGLCARIVSLKNVENHIMTSCVNFLGTIGQVFPSMREKALKLLGDMILKPYPVFENENHYEITLNIRDLVTLHISKCYKASFSSDEQIVPKLRELLDAAIASPRDTHGRCNLLALISHISTQFFCDAVSQTVVPFLIQQLNSATSSRESMAILKHIDSLAIARGVFCFRDVMESLCLMSRNMAVVNTGQVRNTILREIAAKQMAMAKNLKGFPSWNELYLKDLLVLLVEKSADYYKRASEINEQLRASVEDELIWLVYIAHQLLENASEEKRFNSSNDLLVLLRQAWGYCILLGTDSLGEWKPRWQNAMTRFARRTPFLLTKGSSPLIDIEMQTYGFDLGKHRSSEISKVTTVFKKLISMENTELDLNSLLFLLTVYHIENVHVLSKKVNRLYNYCNDLRSSTIGTTFLRLSDQVIARLCRTYKEDYSSKPTILFLARTVMLRSIVVDQEVRDATWRHLRLIVEHFPYCLWDSSVVDLLFELLQVTFLAYNNEILGHICYTYNVSVCGIVHKLDIPRGVEYREQILKLFITFSESWFQVGMEKAAGESTSIIQGYINKYRQVSNQYAQLGLSFAAKFGMSKDACKDLLGTSVDYTTYATDYVDNTARFFDSFWHQTYHTGGIETLKKHLFNSERTFSHIIAEIKQELRLISVSAMRKGVHTEESKLNEIYYRAASILIAQDKLDGELLHLVTWSPIQIFSTASLRAGILAWTWVITTRPEFELRFLNEMADVWEWCSRRSRGIFSQKYNVTNAFCKRTTYGASKPGKDSEIAFSYFLPHLLWIDFIINHYELTRGTSADHLSIYTRLFQSGLQRRGQNSNHPLARLCYLKLWVLVWKLQHDRYVSDPYRGLAFMTKTYEHLLNILSLPVAWNGFDMKFVAAEIVALRTIREFIEKDESLSIFADSTTTATDVSLKVSSVRDMQEIGKIVIEQELYRLSVWYNPVDDPIRGAGLEPFRTVKYFTESFNGPLAYRIWRVSPRLAIQHSIRVASAAYDQELSKLVRKYAFYSVNYPEAVRHLATDENISKNVMQLQYLLFWSPVAPITAISYFLPDYKSNSCLLQFALRCLDYYPVDHVFFYVPQIVQALRYDSLGYAEQFVLKAAKISQLFAHQIIWNMNANMYKDDESMVPDSLKPLLDRIIGRIIKSLSGSDKDFYEREFTFFEKVTGISGKLKPYIRRSKTEKKEKIDEELKKISVDPGVYLPSNPESIVVDIDYQSGRPLQSHAKAPFMATFKIKKSFVEAPTAFEKRQFSYDTLFLQDDQNDEIVCESTDDDEFAWQSAIFKVGDDCRQDVLALQLISLFKNIFTSAGLDAYLFPYRIVATAPGCGIIEVVPNSVSRDQMGRSKVNNLYEWFRAKYGNEDSIQYQKARDSFISSLAAYSVALYLFQIKDRHNGNMLIDDSGHVIHIDFGFIFDITPGGVKFEMSPFKLTTEMVQLLGNSTQSKSYQRFVELCVKSFLVIRPYAEQIITMVRMMLDSGLPCFKEQTISRLRSRFMLHYADKEAAAYMVHLVQSSHKAVSTVVYDGFQKLTNGIPF